MGKLKKFLICFSVCLAVFASHGTALAEVAVSGTDIVDPQKDMTKKERLEKTVYLQNLNYAAACDGVLTVINKNDKSVTPVYKSEKFYIPLRFVLENYGVGVSWDHETKTVVMTAGERQYRLSTKESVMSYGEKTKNLENPCFIENGTTFVAFDDISNIISCKTFYFESYKSGVIYVGEDWDSERKAEKDALSAMEFAVSPFFKMFI